MRQAEIHRKTGETDIAISLVIDGEGRFEGTTGIGFFDHMMNLLACHSGRYGAFFCPMDETLSRIVLDLSGRPYFVYDVKIPVERIGTFETEMTREFFLAFAMHGMMNLHMACLYGENGHHIVESLFKGLGHALKEAVTVEGGRVLSTKGVL